MRYYGGYNEREIAETLALDTEWRGRCLRRLAPEAPRLQLPSREMSGNALPMRS
jgi:hypothetical protein